jgi:hypothetical protein
MKPVFLAGSREQKENRLKMSSGIVPMYLSLFHTI